MTEYASRYDEGRRQISKLSSSDVSTSKRVTDPWSDARIIAQKIDGRDKSFSSTHKEFSRKNVPTKSDMHCRREMDEKSNRPFLEDYKITRKSDVRPSDSSYTRKLSAEMSTIPTEMSTIIHNSKPHLDREVIQNCHIATKHSRRTIADNHRKYFSHSDKRKTVDSDHLPSYFSHISEIKQLNGVSHDSHHYRTTNHVPNGYSHSEINQSQSRDSSHLQSHGSEGNNLLPPSLKRSTDLDKMPFSKYISPAQAQSHISPAALNYVSHTNSKDEYCTPSSQKMVNPEEPFSLPNSSAWGEEENSNEDKSLSVNISNPVTSTPTPEKPRYPYSIEMKEGMFKTVKEGPDHEMLRIHIIENFGSGDLRDGGFSWGWSIEERSSIPPSSRTSSSSKDRSNSSANKDIHKSKRRLEYEKTSGSPTPKKSKMKDGRDVKSNSRESLKVSTEDKSKCSSVAPPKHLSPHIKPHSMHGEKLTKSSKYSHADVKKSPSIGRNFNFERHSGSMMSSPEKRKSPIYVPSSEMIAHLSKKDCSGKNNVIDDSTMGFISSKKERSVVYSGRKSALEVQSLKTMCFESVKKNILGLKIGQNVPFELLLPALKLCSPSKLHKIEEHNRHILRRTDCLWKKFCESEFRDQKRLNGEAWKDVYWRSRNLREAKLKNLAASISNGMSKAHPERQAKWVGVGTNNPEKRQRKNKVEEIHCRVETPKIEEIPVPKPEINGKGSNSSSTHKPSTKKRSGSESSSSNSPQSAQKIISLPKNQVSKTSKKTLAPLMSKTKKMLNFVNRRR